jgi:hypothetical protein
VGGGQRRLMSLPVLDISSELFPEMSPAMRDVRQDVTSPGLVPWAFLDARAGVIQPVTKDPENYRLPSSRQCSNCVSSSRCRRSGPGSKPSRPPSTIDRLDRKTRSDRNRFRGGGSGPRGCGGCGRCSEVRFGREGIPVRLGRSHFRSPGQSLWLPHPSDLQGLETPQRG